MHNTTHRDAVWRLADLQKISAALWFGWAGCQVGLGLEWAAPMLLLCALYNSFAGLRRLSTVYRFEARDPGIPDEFQGVVLLIVLAVANLWIGAYLGVLLIAFDFYIRGRVLAARRLFDGAPTSLAREATPPPDRLDLLQRLGALRDGRVITAAEFDLEKLRINAAGAA